MPPDPTFPLTPDVAAETGIHIGDRSLYIKKNGPHGSYRYEITGHALEDQLYLIGTVMPTVCAAYDLRRQEFYISPELGPLSDIRAKALRSSSMKLWGLPNGRKTNLSIPAAIRSEPRLMRHLARELLATDGVLGFYNTGRNGTHKYCRIQIRLSTGRVIEELENFLKDELGLSLLRRSEVVAHEGWGISHQHISQINRAEDIDTWRREIGFSNPSHISRIMVFEALGECIPRTSILDRLSFLSGRSPRLTASAPITSADLTSVVEEMRMKFGFPRLRAPAILQKVDEINERLELGLDRRLPLMVDRVGPPRGCPHP